MRVAEVDRQPGGLGDLGVQGHFAALVPGQRAAQDLGDVGDLDRHRVGQGGRGAVIGQVQQHHEPGGALDQGADRRARGGTAQDQITFPMAGDRAVIGLVGTVTDVDHVFELATAGFSLRPCDFR